MAANIPKNDLPYHRLYRVISIEDSAADTQRMRYSFCVALGLGRQLLRSSMVRRKIIVDNSAPAEHDGAVALAQTDALLHIEGAQKAFSKATSRAERSAIGPFLTPAPIARFMASLFERDVAPVRILDPGAGTGALFAALTEQLTSRSHHPESIEVVAYEMDRNIMGYLRTTIGVCRDLCAQAGVAFHGVVCCEDFIPAAVSQVHDNLFAAMQDSYTHVILNPPYKKINGATPTRRMLSSAGMETSNLYAAFVWLAVRLTRLGGEIVAITPRSFCNGPYFRRFRKALLGLVDLHHIHTFESRKEASADDRVLQENVIFHGVRNEPQKPTIKISISKGPVFDGMQVRETSFRDVVVPDDPDAFIHLIEEDEGKQVMDRMSRFTATLADLGLEVSTGRVVGFLALS